MISTLCTLHFLQGLASLPLSKLNWRLNPRSHSSFADHVCIYYFALIPSHWHRSGLKGSVTTDLSKMWEFAFVISPPTPFSSSYSFSSPSSSSSSSSSSFHFSSSSLSLARSILKLISIYVYPHLFISMFDNLYLTKTLPLTLYICLNLSLSWSLCPSMCPSVYLHIYLYDYVASFLPLIAILSFTL